MLFSSYKVGDMTLSLPSCVIREILSSISILPVPQSHGEIEGVTFFRNELATVIDLRRCLNQPAESPKGQYIVLEPWEWKKSESGEIEVTTLYQGELLAYRVDGMLEPFESQVSDIQAIPISTAGHLVRHAVEYKGTNYFQICNATLYGQMGGEG